MSAKIIAITSGKGGVGKSTITGNLGVALARLGKKVVCFDADIGLRNLDLILGLEEGILYNVVDVVEGNAELRQALVRDSRVPGLYLLPAPEDRNKGDLHPVQAIAVCEELRGLFDFILIDSPPGIEQGFRTAMAPADDAIVVATPEVSAVHDADRVIGLLQTSGKPNPRLIINRWRPELVSSGNMLDIDQMMDLLSIELLGVVPEDDRVIAGTNKGRPVVLKRQSESGEAFARIARRMIGHKVPIRYSSSLSSRLRQFGRLWKS